jgi:large subunit ribosomal protein L6
MLASAASAVKYFATCGDEMSRVGKVPISLPRGVDVHFEGTRVTVMGPKGELARDISPEMKLEQADGQLLVSRPTDQPRHRAIHGLTRTLVANMVAGVSEGFSKTLEMQGVGYRASMQGKDLVLAIGFSHPVTVPPPPTIEFDVEGTTRIVVRGINKEQVGQVAADVRKIRPPEPYKGKGIRYAGEYVRRKAGKAGKATH